MIKITVQSSSCFASVSLNQDDPSSLLSTKAGQWKVKTSYTESQGLGRAGNRYENTSLMLRII